MTAYRDRLEAGHYQPVTPDATVAELKDQLKARDLPTSGSKDELLARLEPATENDDGE